MAHEIVIDPVKLTKETIQKIEQVASMDGTIEEMCSYADISTQTYYNWMASFPKWKDRLERLRQKPVLKARSSVIRNLDDPDLALRYLERKKKDEFSTKQEIGIYKEEKIEKQLDDAQRAIEQASQIAAGLIQGRSATIDFVDESGKNSPDDSVAGKAAEHSDTANTDR